MAGKFTLATIFEAVDHLSGPAKTMEKNVAHMGESAKRAFSGLKGIIAGAIGGLTVAGALHEITEFAEKGDEISRTSRALGISAEALQKLRYAAKMADVPAEALTTAFRKMNVNLGELRTRQGALYTHLVRTNPALASQLYTTRDSNKAFGFLVDAINHTSDAQERAALTVAAFGKSGQEMLPLIMKGSGAIGEMGDEAKRLGMVMSDDAAKAGEKFHDSLKRITAVGQGLLYQVLGKILEKMAPLIERFADWAIKNDNLARILPKVLFGIGALIVMFGALNAVMDANPVGAIVVSLEALALIAILVVTNWDKIINALKTAWTWFNNLYNKSQALRIAMYFLAAPIWLVVAAVRTLIDLLSGKGLRAFENFIPPWLKGATDAIGLTRGGGGELGGTPVSSNTRVIQSSTTSKSVADINLNNIPPGSTVKQRGSAPGVTLNLGWAATK